MNGPRFSRSLIRPRTKDAVIQEYTESSAFPLDGQKAKWSGEESMLSRFRLGLELVDWPPVRQWLDVGCGTGRFFALAEEQGRLFDQLTGVDITGSLVRQARERQFQSPVRFEACDLETMPENIGQVDLVTLVGVLQLCGCSLEDALGACFRRLKAEGQIFLTTKHLGWSAFEENGFEPEPGHSWFLYEDVARAVEAEGVEIMESGGFLPRDGKAVPLEDSHTLFIWGRKV